MNRGDVADSNDAAERVGNVIDGEGSVDGKKSLKDRTWGRVPDQHKERIKVRIISMDLVQID
jgi:hypothetical protein